MKQKILPTMLKRLLFYLFAIWLLFPQNIYAQLLGNTGHVVKEIVLESEVLDEDRNIMVVLPPAYEDSDQQYPVLFLLDGPAHIDHATAAVQFLATRMRCPQLIIVAIPNVDRTRDLTAVHSDLAPTSGGGKKFLKFLSEELMPYVNENFRAADFNILMGHSLGGYFATYALFEQPELFDGYISISPYLLYSDNHLVDESKDKLKASYENMKYYFMSVGNEPPYFEPLSKFAGNVAEISPKSIRFEYQKLEGEDHGTIPYLSLYSGLRLIFADWQMPQELTQQGLDAVDDHFNKLSERYRMPVQTPELVINALGYYYIQIEDIGAAIEVFTENIKRYPESPNVYDSLGEAYENNREPGKAREYYKKAWELAEAADHPNTGIYRANYERVKE